VSQVLAGEVLEAAESHAIWIAAVLLLFAVA
jgi:hypothetical protein